jgi:DNA-binding PucR family transcriptional regulator
VGQSGSSNGIPDGSGAEACVAAGDRVLGALVGTHVRLADVTAQGQALAAQSGHLSDAVEAFAEHGLSVVAAARALHVHPNTVIYRLERWHTLTGWDPRTFRGLAMSIASLRLQPA